MTLAKNIKEDKKAICGKDASSLSNLTGHNNLVMG